MSESSSPHPVYSASSLLTDPSDIISLMEDLLPLLALPIWAESVILE